MARVRGTFVNIFMAVHTVKSSCTVACKDCKPIDACGAVLTQIWFAVIRIRLAIIARVALDARTVVKWSFGRYYLRTPGAVLTRARRALIVIDTAG